MLKLAFLVGCSAQLSPNDFLAGCGTPCSRSGMGSLLDTSLFINFTPASGGFQITWGSSLPDPKSSILQIPGYTLSGNVLAVLSTGGTQSLGPLKDSSGSTSWPAAMGTVSLSAAWEASLESAFPGKTCPDNLIIAMTLVDQNGVALTAVDDNGNSLDGGSFYSLPFSLCGGAPTPPSIAIRYPSQEGNAGDDSYEAGSDQITFTWNCTGCPFSQAFDLSVEGVDTFGNAVSQTIVEGLTVPNMGSVSFFAAASSTFPCVDSASCAGAVEPSKGASGVTYSFSTDVPSSVAGATLHLIVAPSGAATGSVAGDADVYFSDPAEASTSITLSPVTQSSFLLGGTLTLSWSAVGLVNGDVLSLNLTNGDTGEVFYWLLPGDASALKTATVTLFPFSPQASGGYTLGPLSATALSASLHYQASLYVQRPTFQVVDYSTEFSVLPSGAPSCTASSTGDGATLALGASVTVTWACTGTTLPASPTIGISLWYSLYGEHDPDGDQQVSVIASSQSGAKGTLAVSIPSDPTIVGDSGYYLVVTVDGLPIASANTAYFTIATPSLVIGPLASVVSTCGSSIPLTWTATAVTEPLTLDIFKLGESQRFAQIAVASLDPRTASPLSVTLPTSLPASSYVFSLYNGASLLQSTASALSAPLYVSCSPSIVSVTVVDVNGNPPSVTSPFTLGGTLFIRWVTTNLPSGATLYLSLIDAVSGATLALVTDAAPASSGFYSWATPTSLQTTTNVVARVFFAGAPSPCGQN